MLSLATRRKALIIRLLVVLFGILLLLVSSHLPADFLGLPFQEVVRELATFLLASLLVHWIYELHLKNEVYQDVVDLVIGAGSVSRSGIIDFRENTKSIDYAPLLKNSSDVVIGLHYSPRIIEDAYEHLAVRSKAGKPTTIVASAPDGAALSFLKTARKEHDHVDANLAKIKSLVERLNSQSDATPVQLLYHDQVLRYSFVCTDDLFWVKLYRNSSGMASVPGFAIKAGTDLFRFFERDVRDLLSEAKQRTVDKDNQ
jgi:hypothetical protein